MKKADYSRMAAHYDAGRSLSEQNMEMWLRLISDFSKASAGAEVLDVGCGTGRFAIPMAERVGFRVTGADNSQDMLAKARQRDTLGRVRWDFQNAESLTYPDGSFDVVFMSHLLHHVGQPQRVVEECERVLKCPGAVLVRWGPIEHIRHDVEHAFFPEALEIDEQRTPTVQALEAWLIGAGLSRVTSREILHKRFQTAAEHFDAARVKFTSVLSMISQEAFDKGLAALAHYIQEQPDDPWLLFDSLYLTVGHKEEAAPRPSQAAEAKSCD